VYRHTDGKLRRRKFRFATHLRRGIKTIEDAVIGSDGATGSTVELIDAVADIAALRTFQKPADRIARDIIEHVIGYLLKPSRPTITLVDGDVSLVLNDMFAEMQASSVRETFSVASREFEMVIMKSRLSSGDDTHRVRLLGDCREVKKYSLSDDVPQLPRRFAEEGKRVVFDIYVSGPALDGVNVDQERGRFRFEEIDSDAESLFPGELSMMSLRRTIAATASRALKDLIDPVLERWQRIIRDHVENKSPRYSVLLKTSKEKLDDLPVDLSLERLEGELARMLFQHKQSIETALERELFSSKPIEAHVRRLQEQVHDVQRAQLAEYVLMRHVVIKHLKLALAADPVTGTMQFERVLHDTIFPRKYSASTFDVEDANLWILDERLGFGDEVLSDMPLDVTDNKSPVPDLVVYDRIVTVADGAHPRMVVVFEFKRPGRDDYTFGGRTDPVTQLQQQVGGLRDKVVKLPDGRSRTISATVPIFVHLIADSTASLQTRLRGAGWTASADKQTHVAVDNANNVIYQHISWSELLENASQRHQAFFQRLGLHKP
jgi:hypothetical protein